MNKQLACERIKNYMVKGQDALAVRILDDEIARVVKEEREKNINSILDSGNTTWLIDNANRDVSKAYEKLSKQERE